MRDSSDNLSQHHPLHLANIGSQQLLQASSSRAQASCHKLLLIREVSALFTHVITLEKLSSTCHGHTRTNILVRCASEQTLLAARACRGGMTQRRRGAACGTAMSSHRTTLGCQRFARAVELAEVAEGLATGAMEEFGFPFFRWRLPFHKLRFSRLPFGGIKIRSALMGHRRYPSVAERARRRLHARDVSGDARAERVVNVGNVGGGDQFCGRGKGEVGIWSRGAGVTLAAARRFVSGSEAGESLGQSTSMSSREWMSWGRESASRT